MEEIKARINTNGLSEMMTKEKEIINKRNHVKNLKERNLMRSQVSSYLHRQDKELNLLFSLKQEQKRKAYDLPKHNGKKLKSEINSILIRVEIHF